MEENAVAATMSCGCCSVPSELPCDEFALCGATNAADPEFQRHYRKGLSGKKEAPGQRSPGAMRSSNQQRRIEHQVTCFRLQLVACEDRLPRHRYVKNF